MLLWAPHGAFFYNTIFPSLATRTSFPPILYMWWDCGTNSQNVTHGTGRGIFLLSVHVFSGCGTHSQNVTYGTGSWDLFYSVYILWDSGTHSINVTHGTGSCDVLLTVHILWDTLTKCNSWDKVVREQPCISALLLNLSTAALPTLYSRYFPTENLLSLRCWTSAATERKYK